MSNSMLDRPAEAPAQPAAPQQPKGKSCFFYGCLAAVVVVILAVAGIGLATYMGLRYMKSFTSETRAALPVHDATQADYDDVNTRMESFKQAVESGTSGVELALTAADINTMIAMDPDLAGVKDKAYARIDGDSLALDVSVPLEELMPTMSGRYLNGTAAVSAFMSGGRLYIALEELEVNGKRVPDDFIEELRDQNLADGMYDDPETRELLDKVQDVRVENGRLILVSR